MNDLKVLREALKVGVNPYIKAAKDAVTNRDSKAVSEAVKAAYAAGASTVAYAIETAYDKGGNIDYIVKVSTQVAVSAAESVVDSNYWEKYKK
jgi:hypothetical protein